MEFSNIISILDSSILPRAVVTLNDGEGISYNNQNGETLSATVNGSEYTDLIKVCLIEKENKVKVYLNTISNYNFNKFDLESVSTFSIS